MGVGIRLVDAPVSRRDDPRAHRYIVDHLNPGQEIRRRVAVTNNSDTPQPVQLYPGAAEVGKDGFSFAPDRTGNDLTSWVRLEHTELTLAADETAEVWATITVPKTASAGERYAVLWAEVRSGRDPAANVRNVGRAGVRIYLSVGPGGEPVSDFQIEGITGARNADGVPVVTATVRNTGARALDINGELSLSDGPGGLSAGPVAVKVSTIGLGGTQSVDIPLDRRLPDGRWTARLALASGPVKRTATGTVAFGTAATRPGARPRRSPVRAHRRAARRARLPPPQPAGARVTPSGSTSRRSPHSRLPRGHAGP